MPQDHKSGFVEDGSVLSEEDESDGAVLALALPGYGRLLCFSFCMTWGITIPWMVCREGVKVFTEFDQKDTTSVILRYQHMGTEGTVKAASWDVELSI